MGYCEHRARFEDGGALMQLVLQAPGLQGAAALQATARGYAAMLLYRQARYADAQALARQALALARQARDAAARLVALRALAACAMGTGCLPESQRLWREALALARRLAQPTGPMLDNLAVVAKHLGHYEDSLRLSAEALTQYRATGNHAALALGLSNRASMCMLLDDHEQAGAHLREAAILAEREGLTSTRAYVLANLTELALKTQDWGAARTHAERALELARSGALRALAGWLVVQLARLATRRGEHPLAQRGLADAAAQALALDTPSLKAAVVLGLADLIEGRGHAAAARRLLAFAAEDPGLGAANRDELRAEWARRAAALRAPDPPWPGLALHEVLQRVAGAADSADAPLVALLREGAVT
jgi:tetratricopeptide (TPR) repeat protein